MPRHETPQQMYFSACDCDMEPPLPAMWLHRETIVNEARVDAINKAYYSLLDMSQMSSDTQLTRKPYTGSCHCGYVRYVVYLTLPDLPYPRTTPTEFRRKSGHRIYKCNCTICHKAGILHCRVLDPANDFFVIFPKNPFGDSSGLKSYVPEGSQGAWHFCEHCGVRSFSIRGTGYNDEVDLPIALIQQLNSRMLNGTAGAITARDDEMTRVAVWRPKKDWRETGDEEDASGDYLSINGLALDAHNHNLDLRLLHENGYVAYMQTLQWEGMDYQDTPYWGGSYWSLIICFHVPCQLWWALAKPGIPRLLLPGKRQIHKLSLSWLQYSHTSSFPGFIAYS